MIEPADNPDHTLASNWRARVAQNGSPGGTDTVFYTAWSDSYGGGLLEDGDDDGDGRKNLLEYAMGTSPLVSDAGTSPFVWDPDFSAATYFRNKAPEGIVYHAEYSDDLESWEAAELLSVEDNGDGRERVKVSPPVVTPSTIRKFIRLRVLSSGP